MLGVKRLYTFILGTFLPLLLATFSVCLFILLMVFLWQHINDLVGKGVDMIILAKLFFYASLSFIPMALPLAILLASLMTFGNLGEHFELLAMKASGISLIKIMKPLAIFTLFLAGISFIFQNNIILVAQTKMGTILISLRQKSLELEIPEGVFYKEITGYNVYVRQKDKKTGMLRNMMIYDYSNGFENIVVIAADSGKLSTSNDKKHQILTLYSGESFQNLGTRKTRNPNEQVRYNRETFSSRDILIDFDTNFTMADESIMGSRDIGKNVRELAHYIDSVTVKRDSVNSIIMPQFKKKVYENTFLINNQTRHRFEEENESPIDSIFLAGTDAYYNSLDLPNKIDVLMANKEQAEQAKRDNNIEMFRQNEFNTGIRSHLIQLHTKFSLAISCLLFFFIGAPLGSIIRKGGLGMPTVLSVFIYLTYYITNTFGLKMAKQGVWPVWEGMWLSTLLLILLGAFFTYKAVNDSVMMNPDAWKEFFQRLFGKKEVRNYVRKEVIMETPDYHKNIDEMKQWNIELDNYLNQNKKLFGYIDFWENGFSDASKIEKLSFFKEEWINDLLNSDENLIIGKLMDYPVIQVPKMKFMDHKIIKWLCVIIFPIGLTIYFWATIKKKQIVQDLITCKKVNKNLIREIDNLKIQNKYGI